MIIKKREIPDSLLKLQALHRRIPSTHPKYPLIQEHLSKQLAGYKGEIAIDYPLSFLPEKEYFIFHDLRLKVHEFYFQLDCLLISSRFLVILEIKNIAGTLYFDQEYHQLVRTQDNREEAFPDPIIQVKRHQSLLQKWLTQNGISNVPIHSLVVISSPYSLIRSSNELSNTIIHRDYLPEKITQLQRKFVDKVILEKEIKSISRKLLKQHHSYTSSILERYQIAKEELKTGVICTKCESLPMSRAYGTWYCPNCYQNSKDAHEKGLKDYLHLLGTTITSKELRAFLQISSPKLATRILQSMNLPTTGTKKGTVYDLTVLTGLK